MRVLGFEISDQKFQIGDASQSTLPGLDRTCYTGRNSKRCPLTSRTKSHEFAACN
jgi:hypothetical protein